MVQFCTNCGTKLDDDDFFCMNCGTKVDASNIKSKNLFNRLQSKRANLIQKKEERKKNMKAVEKVVGEIRFNNSFKTELEKNGLSDIEGLSIKNQLLQELGSGQIKRADVKNRTIELISENKTKVEKQIPEFKVVDDLFRSEEIRLKMKESNFTASQVVSIKGRVKNKIRFDENANLNENEIIKYIDAEVVNQRNINKINERENEKIELRNNTRKYLEEIIKDSCPNIKLATFEKEYMNKVELNSGTISEMKNELNRSAKKIINPHKKIGEYDFAGKLIEEGGFTNAVDIVGLEKRARKDSDLISYVFLKIFENNIKIVGSEIEPIYLSLHITPKYKGIAGKDRTIFFSDITSISYSNGEIHFNLLNKERLILKEEKNSYTGKNIEAFYKLLNTAWENFKNNENELSSINKKEEVSVADELMKYAELYEKGLLTEEEFAVMKKKLIEG